MTYEQSQLRAYSEVSTYFVHLPTLPRRYPPHTSRHEGKLGDKMLSVLITSESTQPSLMAAASEAAILAGPLSG
jgi:hypothetical protein